MSPLLWHNDTMSKYWLVSLISCISIVWERSRGQILNRWLGDIVDFVIGLPCRGWRASTTTSCRSQLYPPSQGLWIWQQMNGPTIPHPLPSSDLPAYIEAEVEFSNKKEKHRKNNSVIKCTSLTLPVLYHGWKFLDYLILNLNYFDLYA